MTRSRPIGLLVSAAVIALVALTFAAGAHVATAGATHPTVAIEPSVNAASVTRNSPRPTVQVRRTGLGQILVDSRGRTLYLFKKDIGGKSACSGSCGQVALAWLLACSPAILPIQGTASAAHLEENVAAASLCLDDEEVLAIASAVS
jgi:hypothetical protein